jgi:hypothetical protein
MTRIATTKVPLWRLFLVNVAGFFIALQYMNGGTSTVLVARAATNAAVIVASDDAAVAAAARPAAAGAAAGLWRNAEQMTGEMDLRGLQLCESNVFKHSLKDGFSLAAIDAKANRWLANRAVITEDIRRAAGERYDRTRWGLFDEMGRCEQACVGGKCRDDASKIICGFDRVPEENCIVYSLGSNNDFWFELGVLQRSPCTVYTFDCTGPRSRFDRVPKSPRLHFYHYYIGDATRPAPLPASLPPLLVGVHDRRMHGAMDTLPDLIAHLGHSHVDIFKMDIEGYEYPVFEGMFLMDRPSDVYSFVLPRQILVELHWNTWALKKQATHKAAISEIAAHGSVDQLANSQARLLQMGYATIVRDDNAACVHCMELTLLRFKC